MNNYNTSYHSFNYSIDQLLAFLFYQNVFFILLKDESIIRFKPDSIKQFRNWLLANGIREVKTEIKC